MLTRVFKSGNSLAVRIPKELAFIVLRPVQQKTLAGIGAVFASFSPGFMAEGREFHEEPQRDWGAFGQGNKKE